MGRLRRCDKRCHSAKGKRCNCWCGGYFHGTNEAATVHRKELYDGLTTLEEHGFEKGKTKFIAQQGMPGVHDGLP